MSLRRRVLWGTLAVAAVMLVVGVVGAAAIQRTVRDAQRAEVARQGRATARLVESVLDGRLRSRLLVADVLAAVEAVGDHDYVEAAVRGPNGAVNVLGDENQLFAALPAAGTDQQVIEVVVDGRTVLATVVSVPAGDRGNVLIAIGRTEVTGVAATVGRTILVALGVGAVVAVVLAVGLSAALGRRLDRVSDAARALAAGDFTARLEEHGDAELAAVARAFNEMADRLEAGRTRERDFLLSVGHDLRTPLTTIRGYAEGLAAGDLPAEDLARVGRVLDAQANRLARLVDDLMMLARLEAREFTLAFELVDVAAHVQGIVDGHVARARQFGVRLDARIENVGMRRLDPDRVAQIAGNLIDNALRYTPEQGTVTVSLADDAGMAVLTVADTGPGIDPIDLPRVFERLYVAQKYRPVRPEGSGLGLSIVKALADAMGASVSVDSELGRGTTVRVRFPAATADSVVPAPL